MHNKGQYIKIIPCLILFFWGTNATSAQGSTAKVAPKQMLIGFPLMVKDFSKVSSAFGPRMHPLLKKNRDHTGIDLVAEVGRPVYATAQGIVITSRYEAGYGHNIVLAHRGHLKTLYAHLWVRTVKRMDTVHKGQLIGFVGNSGAITGPHLHFEIWYKNIKMDPLTVWKSQLVISRSMAVTKDSIGIR